MFKEIFVKSSKLQSDLSTCIRQSEANNRKRESASRNYYQLLSGFNKLDYELTLTNQMLSEISIVTKDFKEKRKRFIETSIQEALRNTLDEDYVVKIKLTPYKDKTKASLRLFTIDSNGEEVEFNPTTQNGGLCRQVIALAGGMAINKLQGCNLLFMDEAANGGDSVSLRKLQGLIKDFLKNDDAQILLNEHNGSLYQDLPHRTYFMDKVGTGVTGHLVQLDMVDSDGIDLEDIVIEYSEV